MVGCGTYIYTGHGVMYDPALALGLNVVEGKVVYKAIADVFNLKYEPIKDIK